MNIVLKTGLVLRSGQRTLELTRVLAEDRVQFEDTLTRRAITLRTAELMKRLWTGRYKVVLGAMEGRQTTRAGDDPHDLAPASPPPMVDLTQIPPSWRAQIEYRMRYLKGLQAAHVSRGDRVRVARVIKTVARATADASAPTSSTVMDWARRFHKAECNPLSLVDNIKTGPRSRRMPKKIDEIITSTLRTQYFTLARNSLRHAHDCIQRELKLAVRNGELNQDQANVGYATVCRRAKEVDAYRRIASREGDARARMVCRSTMDGASAAYPLQRVEVDHTPLDWVVVSDETGLPLGRPLLTVAMDAYSGYILGMYLSFYGPGVTSVAGVLRNSVMPKSDLVAELGLKNPWLSHGLADEWVLDNGLEFHSRAFKGMSWELGIDMTYCRVRTPWLKPHVERFFAGLSHLTLAKGRVRKGVANSRKTDPYKDASITFGDLVKGLMMFIVDVYPFQINQRKLARPFDLFQDGLDRCPPAIYPGSWENMRLISGLSKTLTVHQGGVELVGLPYGSAELLPLIKQHGGRFKALCKWDPNDMGYLFVQNPTRLTEWVQCPCRWGEYANGLSWNQHLHIRKFAREDLAAKGAQEKLRSARMDLHDHWMNASRPKDRKNSLKAAHFAGLTSSRIISSDVPERQTPSPAQLIVEPPTPLIEADIPEFEAFYLGPR